jgi:hypothetical protein
VDFIALDHVLIHGFHSTNIKEEFVCSGRALQLYLEFVEAYDAVWREVFCENLIQNTQET